LSAAAVLLVAGACNRRAIVSVVAADAGAERSGPTAPLSRDERDRQDKIDLGPEGRPVVPCPVGDDADLDATLDEAARRYDRGEYPAALACAELAARIYPKSVEAHHNRALCLAAMERWDEAKHAFTYALALDPDDPETLEAAADFYINRVAPTREYSEIGLEYARRGSAMVGRRRDDRRLASRLALLEAQALDDLAHSDEALSRADAAILLDPANLDARYEKAVILFHLCRFDAARGAFEDVLLRTPDDAFAHHHLGLILEREGRVADAEAHFARAHVLDPQQFPTPVLIPAAEFQAVVDQALRELPPETRKLLEGVAIEVADLPALEDLTAVDPPFAPTILGLFRGAPLGEPKDVDEPRAIVLYRKNLGRAVTSRAELDKQIRITLWHEIGHLRGHDEDELRARGLE
jgi:predicted Zn-dependent protease with MMP-like domain